MTVEPILAEEIAERLRTVRFGRPLQVHRRVTSTNDLARMLAAGGAPEGTAVIASEQSHGRGRLGRRWTSPAGGLYFSIVLRPLLPRERWSLISLAAAVGAAAGAEAVAGVPIKVKWPNDLLLDGDKVGGILVEAAEETAVCGIGINVIPPAGGTREAQAAWLAVRNPQLSLTALASEVLLECERRYVRLYEDAPAVLAEWRSRSATLGRHVHVAGPEEIDGIAEDVDESGALLVRTAEGVRRVLAGDVQHPQHME